MAKQTSAVEPISWSSEQQADQTGLSNNKCTFD